MRLILIKEVVFLQSLQKSVGDRVAKELERLTGLESRNTTLGYMQSVVHHLHDRVTLSTQYGAKAMELALEHAANLEY